MKITQFQLFQDIKVLKPSKCSYPSESDVTKFVAKKLKITPNDQLSICIRNQLRCYKKKMQQQDPKHSNNRENFGDPCLIVIDTDDYEQALYEEKIDSTTKIQRKSFQCIGNKMRRERTQPIVDLLDNFTKENELTINELFGYQHR